MFFLQKKELEYQQEYDQDLKLLKNKKKMVNWLPIKIIVATALMCKFHLLYKP